MTNEQAHVDHGTALLIRVHFLNRAHYNIA
jgi:hypothetical protein